MELAQSSGQMELEEAEAPNTENESLEEEQWNHIMSFFFIINKSILMMTMLTRLQWNDHRFIFLSGPENILYGLIEPGGSSLFKNMFQYYLFRRWVVI